jgi:hypothetical protein
MPTEQKAGYDRNGVGALERSPAVDPALEHNPASTE